MLAIPRPACVERRTAGTPAWMPLNRQDKPGIERKTKTMQDYKIRRDGLPPIVFTGEEIGKGSNRIRGGRDSTRWTNVTLYTTKGGRFVAHVERVTQWQGESDRDTATSKETANEIIQWLKDDAGADTLGEASQCAVEQAVKVCPDFAAAWVETVE